MANNVSNVYAGKPAPGGAIFRAPLGTTLPTDAVTALPEAYKNLGYVSDDGLTNGSDITINEIRAWGGDVVLAPKTGQADTFRFVLIEALNVEVDKAIYGSANVTGTLAEGLTVKANGAEQEEAVWVFEIRGRSGEKIRIVVPDGKITSLGDVVYNDSSAVGYDVTITAMPYGSDDSTHITYKKT